MSDNGREGFDFKCGEKAMGCSQLSAQVNNERRYASAQDGKGNQEEREEHKPWLAGNVLMGCKDGY